MFVIFGCPFYHKKSREFDADMAPIKREKWEYVNVLVHVRYPWVKLNHKHIKLHKNDVVIEFVYLFFVYIPLFIHIYQVSGWVALADLLRSEATFLLRQLLVVVVVIQEFVWQAEKGSPFEGFRHAHHRSWSCKHHIIRDRGFWTSYEILKYIVLVSSEI